MLKTTILLLISGMITVVFAQKKQVNLALGEYLSKLPPSVVVSMQVEDMNRRVFFAQNENRSVPAASIIKIPILVELMEQVKAKQIDLQTVYELKDADKTAGSGMIAGKPVGTKYTVGQLAFYMITISDNTATNILINKIGRENVNQRMKSLNLSNLQLNRVMLDTTAVKQGRENYVTPLQINELLRKIYKKQVATPELCDMMIQFLLANTDTVTLPHLLPKDLKMAHKTGGLTYVRGDAGIVYTQKPYIISVLVQNNNTPEAEKIIAEISLIVYNHLK